MKKILFVLSVNQMGGIISSLEALCSLLINNYDISIITLDNKKIDFIQAQNCEQIFVPKKFQRLYLSLSEIIEKENYFACIQSFFIKLFIKTIGLFPLINSYCKKYSVPKEFDCAIAFTNDIFINNRYTGGANEFVLQCVNAKTKVGWIHNDPTKYNFTEKNSFETLRRFDKIVNVSVGCKDIFDSIFPRLLSKSVVVHNTIEPEKILKKSQEEICDAWKTNKIKLLTVARIDNQQKRIDRAISAAKYMIECGFTNFEWIIIGDGPDFYKIKQEVISQELESYIRLLGRRINPYPYMKKADLFVLSSAYESYGIVLSEALLLGCPVFSTYYDAVYEVVDQNNSIVCENDDDIFSDVLYTTISNKTVLEQIRMCAKKYVPNCSIVYQEFNGVIEEESI